MKRLLVGYKAIDLDSKLLSGETTVHELDVYHAHAVNKLHPEAVVVCTPHLPQGPWDEIVFRTGPKLMSGELALDLLQEIHLLRPGKFTLDFVGKERDRNDLINKIKNDPDRVRNFAAKWPASVPGGKPLSFISVPGCFCHRRQDEGGLALAEVVSKELTLARAEFENQSGDVNLLDMGCGCGLVGFLVASVVPKINITMIDSHSRAVEAARLNASNFNVKTDVILADNGIDDLDRDSTYDVFVGNPPYYSDYRIAEVFLDTAKKALRAGGTCYTVVKNDAGLRPVQEKYFPQVEVIRRRGYCVLKSVKKV